MCFCLFDFLKKQEVEYYRNLELSRLSTIGIGGIPLCVIYPSSEEKLILTVRFLLKNNIPYKIAGGMSNILFSSPLDDVAVIKTDRMNIYSVAENIIEVSSGVKLTSLIYNASGIGLGGIEELYGIPGSIGGAIFGNAGAYGRSISDFVKSIKIFDTAMDNVKIIPRELIDFKYRSSGLADGEIILSAKLSFVKKDPDLITVKLKGIIEDRISRQPYGKRSLGSIFKRKDGFPPISYLIDSLGLKGFSFGDAEISEMHAGFIVNRGGATASDVIELISIIKNKINLEFGFIPEEEIKII